MVRIQYFINYRYHTQYNRRYLYLLFSAFQCRVLLNLRTSQPFEEVVEDLGQVLKINGAKRMYTVSGQEVRINIT